MMGASINPTPSPNKMFATKIIQTLLAEYIMNQAMTWGMLTISIARFLPIGSEWGIRIYYYNQMYSSCVAQKLPVIQPDAILPSGWQIYAILPLNMTYNERKVDDF